MKPETTSNITQMKTEWQQGRKNEILLLILINLYWSLNITWQCNKGFERLTVRFLPYDKIKSIEKEHIPFRERKAVISQTF